MLAEELGLDEKAELADIATEAQAALGLALEEETVLRRVSLCHATLLERRRAKQSAWGQRVESRPLPKGGAHRRSLATSALSALGGSPEGPPSWLAHCHSLSGG